MRGIISDFLSQRNRPEGNMRKSLVPLSALTDAELLSGLSKCSHAVADARNRHYEFMQEIERRRMLKLEQEKRPK